MICLRQQVEIQYHTLVFIIFVLSLKTSIINKVTHTQHVVITNNAQNQKLQVIYKTGADQTQYSKKRNYQMPWRYYHSLLTSQTRCVLFVVIENPPEKSAYKKANSYGLTISSKNVSQL